MTGVRRLESRLRQALSRILWLGTIALSHGSLAADQSATLAKVKTAYLFNIAKFVNWPGEQHTVTLCVNQDSAIKDYLAKLHNRAIGNDRSLRVLETPDMAENCHIYYSDEPAITDGPVATTTPLKDNAQVLPSVLAVSDHASALERGYAFQFHLQREKLSFRFSKSVLDRSNFKVSSKLLQLGSSDS